MTRKLYRTMVVGGVLNWLLVGFHLCDLLSAVVVGGRPTFAEASLLVAFTILGVLNASALLRVPISCPAGSSNAPAA